MVDESVRGTGVGRVLLEALVNLAREEGCYKVILDSSMECVGFFEKCSPPFFQNDVASAHPAPPCHPPLTHPAPPVAHYFEPPPPLRFPVEVGPGEILHSWHMTV